MADRVDVDVIMPELPLTRMDWVKTSSIPDLPAGEDAKMLGKKVDGSLVGVMRSDLDGGDGPGPEPGVGFTYKEWDPSTTLEESDPVFSEFLGNSPIPLTPVTYQGDRFSDSSTEPFYAAAGNYGEGYNAITDSFFMQMTATTGADTEASLILFFGDVLNTGRLINLDTGEITDLTGQTVGTLKPGGPYRVDFAANGYTLHDEDDGSVSITLPLDVKGIPPTLTAWFTYVGSGTPEESTYELVASPDPLGTLTLPSGRTRYVNETSVFPNDIEAGDFLRVVGSAAMVYGTPFIPGDTAIIVETNPVKYTAVLEPERNTSENKYRASVPTDFPTILAAVNYLSRRPRVEVLGAELTVEGGNYDNTSLSWGVGDTPWLEIKLGEPDNPVVYECESDKPMLTNGIAGSRLGALYGNVVLNSEVALSEFSPLAISLGAVQWTHGYGSPTGISGSDDGAFVVTGTGSGKRATVNLSGDGARSARIVVKNLEDVSLAGFTRVSAWFATMAVEQVRYINVYNSSGITVETRGDDSPKEIDVRATDVAIYLKSAGGERIIASTNMGQNTMSTVTLHDRSAFAQDAAATDPFIQVLNGADLRVRAWGYNIDFGPGKAVYLGTGSTLWFHTQCSITETTEIMMDKGSTLTMLLAPEGVFGAPVGFSQHPSVFIRNGAGNPVKYWDWPTGMSGDWLKVTEPPVTLNLKGWFLEDEGG